MRYMVGPVLPMMPTKDGSFGAHWCSAPQPVLVNKQVPQTGGLHSSVVFHSDSYRNNTTWVVHAHQRLCSSRCRLLGFHAANKHCRMAKKLEVGVSVWEGFMLASQVGGAGVRSLACLPTTTLAGWQAGRQVPEVCLYLLRIAALVECIPTQLPLDRWSLAGPLHVDGTGISVFNATAVIHVPSQLQRMFVRILGPSSNHSV
jgi:hypothetical protein